MTRTRKAANVGDMALPGMEDAREEGTKRNGSTSIANRLNLPNWDQRLGVPVLSFEDPDRPKSALEVDFPIGPINTLAQAEVNAKKPIYEMGKWWARRQSSIFRALLIAAAMEAPTDEEQADRVVWDAYYANHQAAGNFRHLKVLDPFMGGGTTLVEGARLGFQVAGVDLNPVAWFVTKTSLAAADPGEVARLFASVERKVRPQVGLFSATDCPRGHRGIWFRADTEDCPFDVTVAEAEGHTLVAQPPSFDIHGVPENERGLYRYAGPEVIYTFWGKHAPCPRCDNQWRTPVMPSPVVATKELTVRYVRSSCQGCGLSFDWELDDARMAPSEPLVVAETERPYVAPQHGVSSAKCPACGVLVERPRIAKPERKKVTLTLLIHPAWLRGHAGIDSSGELGGWAGASLEAERRWIDGRARDLSFVEVRGDLPDTIPDPIDRAGSIESRTGTAKTVARAGEGGRVEDKAVGSSYVCGHCGQGQDFLTAVEATGHTAPAFPYLAHGYCPKCDEERRPYNGRFFKALDRLDRGRWLASYSEWQRVQSTPLAQWVPTESLPFAHETYIRRPLSRWGYSHWWKMFNSRQLLIIARLISCIDESIVYSEPAREAAILAFQQYLRNQNMFCFWNLAGDKMEPFFSNNNYHPKASVIENGVFSQLGRGNWLSCTQGVLQGLAWAREPWERVSGVSSQVAMHDPIPPGSDEDVSVGSATDLAQFSDRSVDLVITDPPFGDNIFYADLADFFYVWLRHPLGKRYPHYFTTPDTNKVQEAISNPAEHPDDRSAGEKRLARISGAESPADEFYRLTLTQSWEESARVLKDAGTLAFTFHHSEDRAWVGVLRSLFDGGFVLVGTYPVRSDETKGEKAAFGSQKIEFDIIHVCRKRLDEPRRVSWAQMRRWVKDELGRLHGLLVHYQRRQLSEADIRVVLRGKALEYYSRHYGQVFTGDDEPVDVAQALVDINELLEEERLAPVERPPFEAEPLTRVYLRLFRAGPQVPRDEMTKLLKGTGVTAQQLADRGWTSEENRFVSIVPVQVRFARFKGRPRTEMKSDLDQAHFLIGAGVDGSGINIREELTRTTFPLRAAVPAILRWYADREPDDTLRDAAQRALSIVERWKSDAPERLVQGALLAE